MMNGSRAVRIQERLQQLGSITEIPGQLFRPFGSKSMRKANALVAQWMEEAGIHARTDAIGNLRGRKNGVTEKLLLIGSHLDTVRNAGIYDGALGVVLAIEALEGLELPYSVELIAFCDEEGERFHSTYLGSNAVAGNPPSLSLRDESGTTLEEAIRTFGGDPERLSELRPAGELIGYFEAHIEQGPVLQEKNVPIGTVSGIAGQNRGLLTLQGCAGHAGTVPMELRRDALCGAAEFILQAEETAKATPGLVATIGKVHLADAASNVIPGTVTLTLDLRHPDDGIRNQSWNTLQKVFEKIADRRSLIARWETVQTTSAVKCCENLSRILEKSAATVAAQVPALVSGAGHDAVALAALCPVVMLFVRCRDGISHSPEESVTTTDIDIALEVIRTFLRNLST